MACNATVLFAQLQGPVLLNACAVIPVFNIAQLAQSPAAGKELVGAAKVKLIVAPLKIPL